MVDDGEGFSRLDEEVRGAEEEGSGFELEAQGPFGAQAAVRAETFLRKDQALTEARRRSRERDDAAQIWAAWVLVGDAR